MKFINSLVHARAQARAWPTLSQSLPHTHRTMSLTQAHKYTPFWLELRLCNNSYWQPPEQLGAVQQGSKSNHRARAKNNSFISRSRSLLFMFIPPSHFTTPSVCCLTAYCLPLPTDSATVSPHLSLPPFWIKCQLQLLIRMDAGNVCFLYLEYYCHWWCQMVLYANECLLVKVKKLKSSLEIIDFIIDFIF